MVGDGGIWGKSWVTSGWRRRARLRVAVGDDGDDVCGEEEREVVGIEIGR